MPDTVTQDAPASVPLPLPAPAAPATARTPAESADPTVRYVVDAS